jgi:transposase
MIGTEGALRVYVATRPIDFRKGHDGLAAAVATMFGHDPFSGAVFVFRSKRADRLKRLEGGKFVWPQVRDGVMKMSPAQFSALFEGLDWRLVRPERVRRPQLAG